MLDSKCGGWRNLDEVRKTTSRSVWWQDLRSICHLVGEGSWFKSGIKWRVGCGSKMRFWEDGWKEDDVPLMEK